MLGEVHGTVSIGDYFSTKASSVCDHAEIVAKNEEIRGHSKTQQDQLTFIKRAI
jgi:hypothetical protein